MKRIIFLVASAVAACAALASCNKLNSSAEEPAAPKTHTVSFAAAQSDTRTSMTIEDGYAYFSWEEADVDSIYVYENDTPGIVSAHLEGDRMMISATFPGDAPDSATYYAHVNSWNVEQCPGPGCYDGCADILVAEPVTATPEDGILPLVFSREVAVNKMTIKGLGPGETIIAVSISSDEDPDVALSGTYCKNGWSDCDNDIYTYPEGVVSDSDGNAVIYFTSLPAEDVFLFVAVMTDNGAREKYYDKTLSRPITFRKGEVKSFVVALEYEEEIPEITRVENFNAPNGKTSVTSVYGSPAKATEEGKGNKGFVNMGGFTYKGWACPADADYVTVFAGGIVLGGLEGEPGAISNTDMLSGIPGDFVVRIHSSWWGTVSEEDLFDALTVTYRDGDAGCDVSINSGENYLACIQSPQDRTYSAADFSRYKEFFFTRSDSDSFTISVKPGLRILIDKVEILYYGGGDEDGGDITVDDPEG